MEANVLGGFQAISVPAGIYRLTLVGTDENQGRTGDLDISGDINISAVSNSRPIIDGNGLDRVFDIHSGTRSAAFGGLTIRNGDATKSRFNSIGGGISVENTTALLISGCTITANRAQNGAGMVIRSGSLFIVGSRIRNNQSEVAPGSFVVGTGGILSAVNTDIIDSTISGNQGELAGGIRMFALSGSTVNLTIRSSTISDHAWCA